MGNSNLNKAKGAKKDEFYTSLHDIEQELKHYKDFFRGKRIYCPCDDARWSNFWWYFVTNFNHLGLKSLDASCFHADQHGEHWHYEGEAPNDILRNCAWHKNRSLMFDFCDYEVFEDDGGFQYRDDLFADADVIVTNPPFSLFRDFTDKIMAAKKDFVIWGNINAIKYKNIFPFTKTGVIKPGYLFNTVCTFRIPDDYDEWDEKATAEMDDGNHYAKVPMIATFTNLDIKKYHTRTEYYERYSPEKYPRYDNYDAIEVQKSKLVPCDYTGVMGVPITFFSQYCVEQFEIIDKVSNAKLNGVNKYDRILIRWKPEAMPRINEKGVIIYD